MTKDIVRLASSWIVTRLAGKSKRDGYLSVLSAKDPRTGMGPAAVVPGCQLTVARIKPGSMQILLTLLVSCHPADPDSSGRPSSSCDVASWFVDEDGDGFGGESLGSECEQPEAAAATGGDCDDGDPLVAPGLDPGACADGVWDCGSTCRYAGEYLARDAAAHVFEGADTFEDMAALGAPLQAGRDLDSHGGPDLLSRLRLLSLDNEEMGLIYFDSDVTGGWENFQMAGDVNGDGHDDVVFSSTGVRDGEGNWTGEQTWLVLGPLVGDVEVATVGTRLNVPANERSLAGVGDLDGDGFDDFIVTRWGTEDNPAQEAWLLAGSPTAPLQRQVGIIAGVADPSGDFGDISGYGEDGIAALGDVDGDGRADFASFSVNRDGAGRSNRGVVFVWEHSPSGTVSMSDADAACWGSTDGEMAGSHAASAGDVNGDGYGDLIAGAVNHIHLDSDEDTEPTRKNVAYLVLGPVTESGAFVDRSEAIFYGKWGGESDGSGATVGAVGDLDGDGNGDFGIGLPNVYGGKDGYETGRADWTGAVALLYGPRSGAVMVPEEADAWFHGDTGEHFVSAFAAASDMDGDGFGDFVISSAPNALYLIGGQVP